MNTRAKLHSLRNHLAEEQKRLIFGAAEVDAVPPAHLISRIADLETAILAVETLMEDAGDQQRRGADASVDASERTGSPSERGGVSASA